MPHLAYFLRVKYIMLRTFLIWYSFLLVSSNFLHADNPALFEYNHDKGWEKPVKISSKKGTAEFPVVAEYDDYIHLVWQDKRTGDFQIFYKAGRNIGEEWSEPKNITQTKDD